MKRVCARLLAAKLNQNELCALKCQERNKNYCHHFGGFSVRCVRRIDSICRFWPRHNDLLTILLCKIVVPTPHTHKVISKHLRTAFISINFSTFPFIHAHLTHNSFPSSLFIELSFCQNVCPKRDRA